MKILRYNAALNQITGSMSTTVVMLQLEHWFNIMNNKAFYKFMEPCDAMCYKKGQSWSEELGISRVEFRNAFCKIGKIYKTKTAYEQSEDKFEGMLYVAYYDRAKRLTYYIRNHEAVEKCLREVARIEMEEAVESENVIVLEQPKYVEHTEVALSESEKVTVSEQRNDVKKVEVECEDTLESAKLTFPEYHNVIVENNTCIDSRTVECDSPLSLDNYKDNNKRLQTEMTLEKKGMVGKQTPYEECIKHYHTICPHLVPVLKMNDRLRERLDHLFGIGGITMEQFDQMLETVQASDFLSGRIGDNAWKANLEWMVKEDKFWEILEGKYQNFAKTERQKKQNRFNDISSHNWDFAKLEEIEAQYIEDNALDPIVANSPLMKRLYEARAELAAQGIEVM